MGLIIKAVRSQPDTMALVATELSLFCERSFEDNGAFVIIPLPGKLIEIMRILKKHSVVYEFETDSRPHKPDEIV